MVGVPMTFRLYKQAQAWWSFADYATVLSVMLELRARTVLEFGPGSSTLALIEGGATQIDCCEDDPVWFRTYCERLEDVYNKTVLMVPYTWADPLNVPGIREEGYDLALIDGPLQIERRAAVIRFCAERCRYLLVPLEDSEPNDLRAACESLGRPVKYIASGPLAGTFALVGPAC